MFKKQFKWLGINRSGQVVQGVSAMASAQALRDELTQQRIRPLRIQRQWQFKPRALAREHITRFAQQLSSLISANVPLLQALEILERSQKTVRLQELSRLLKNQVETGASFYQAALASKQFDPMFCHVIAASEISGQLDVLLARLCAHREKTDRLRANLRSALTYPCLVLIISLVVMCGLLVFVVPSFESVFASFGAELPLFTRWIISLSRQLSGLSWFGFLASLLLMAMVARLFKPPLSFLLFAENLALKLPLFGSAIQHFCLAHWSRTLCTLTTAGVPLNEALWATISMTQWLSYQRAIENLHAQINQGKSLAQALQHHAALFPDMVIQMCWIGEESGNLDAMLEKVAEHYEAEMTRFADQLGVLLEPLIMTVLGLLVGALMLALYLPVFQLGQVI